MKDLPIDDDDNDPIWRALAHRTRRRLLDLLRDGPRTTGELVDALGTGRHQVLQHLAVLREADLVLVDVQGRRRVNHLNPVPIQLIYQRWVAKYQEDWAAALVGLRATVEARQAGRFDERFDERERRRSG
jgi:DNA-binding transcriptional ArsR family regulator